MAQVLNASNTSGVYIKLESTPGTFATPAGTDFVPTVGTPKFTPRGAGIIRRADVMTPYGGELAAKTGGIGWDISFTTELYWNFLAGAPGAFTANPAQANSVLYALFRSCPFTIASGGTNDFKFVSQAIYDVAATRSSANNQCATFSIAYEEIGAKRYEASGCVCIPKFTFEAGGKITIEWSIKGLWRPVTSTGTALVPTYAYPAPLIGINASLTAAAPIGSYTSALAKVSYDPGYALSDVLDAQATYGMGIAMISLTSSPSIELEVADLAESTQPDWTTAQANTVASAFDVTLTITVDTLVVFSLNEPQLVQWPTPGESNGYRNIGLKFAGIVNSNSATDIGSIGFYAPA